MIGIVSFHPLLSGRADIRFTPTGDGEIINDWTNPREPDRVAYDASLDKPTPQEPYADFLPRGRKR